MAVGGRRSAVLRALLYLVLILVTIYTLIPLVTMVMTSVRSSADLYQGPFSIPREFQLLENFRKAWVVGKFGIYVKNSFIITIPTVALVLCLTTLSGYAFAKIRFPLRDFFFYLILLGMMVPFQATMIPLYFLLNSFHILNTHLAVILPLGIGGLPFGTFMMRSFFKGLSDELIESSKLDGCGELQTFTHIMLPLTYPAWVSLIIFQSMWTWNNFLVPLLFIYDDKLRPIPLGLMFFQDRYTTDYTLVAAAVIISMIPLVVLFLFLQRKFTSSITLGAVKG
jgi:ABC-type glycerol-3-phosphate transport system permease component